MRRVHGLLTELMYNCELCLRIHVARSREGKPVSPAPSPARENYQVDKQFIV